MATGAPSATETGERTPAQLLSRLIRFDTSNPPGAERECIEFIEGLLSAAGLETTICAAERDRPNLVARLRGRGEAPPLLLYGHVDVVPADAAEWRHPPFAGELADGCVWGRGALDMKGGVAMILAALLEMASGGSPPARDLIFAALCDEEAGSRLGARYVVEEHAHLFDGVRHAIGEFGGYTVHIGGRRFYPIQVAEKQRCAVRITVRGPGGHGSLPLRGGATAKLAQVLRRLDRRRLPVHVTPVTQRMVEEIAGALPAPAGLALRQFLRPGLTDRLLDLPGLDPRLLDPLLHDTAVPTIVRAGQSRNVIPSSASVEVDGRLLPGRGADEFVQELRDLLGDEVELEVIHFDPVPEALDLDLFDALAGIIAELDPGAVAVPMLLPGASDGRVFARLGIQTYGFLPLKLEPSFKFMDLIHAADERVPVRALEFGTRALEKLLSR